MVVFQWQVLHEALSNTKMRNTLSALTPTGQMAREKCAEMETAYSVGSGVRQLGWNPCSRLYCVTLGKFMNLSVP